MPGGLGSTMKVLILGKGVGRPALAGRPSRCASHDRGSVWRSWSCRRARRSRASSRSGRGTRRSRGPASSCSPTRSSSARAASRGSDPRRASSRCSPLCRFRCGWCSRATTSFIDNWYYTGLPENAALRMFGYAWSFATIWPAIFEAAELIGVCAGRRRRGEPAGRDARTSWSRRRSSSRPACPCRPYLPACLALSLAAGAAMLVSPFLVSPAIARYLAAPVWLGFIFLLDPINARLGGESLSDDWRAGRRDRVIDLAAQRVAVRRAVGVLELLVAREVALHGADHGEHEDLRDARARLSRVSRVRARMLHDVRVPAADLSRLSPDAAPGFSRTVAPPDGPTTCDPSRDDPPRAHSHRRPRHAPEAADRRAREAGDSGRRRADDPAHHPRARGARRERPRAEPAPSSRTRSRPSSATGAISAPACAIRGSRASSGAPADRVSPGRSSAPTTS